MKIVTPELQELAKLVDACRNGACFDHIVYWKLERYLENITPQHHQRLMEKLQEKLREMKTRTLH
jgi:hypothetical protein